jgi:serine/threonine-protein kinase HipA
MSDRLAVWWDGRITGFLYLNPDGHTRFVYDDAWLADKNAPALSFSLPKQTEPFKRKACQAFFGGFLPEETQRTAIARVLGVSADNEYRLLVHLGGEVAGALTLLPENKTLLNPDNAAPTPLSDEKLLNLLDEMPIRPMLAGKDGLRLSLAGAQSKLPVLVIGDQIALPAPGQPTSHILKPPIARFEGTSENEYFCMSLAGAIGLNVATVQIRCVAGRPFLLITRYDRQMDGAGGHIRLHQEDFAQALGIASHQKYASDGGPNFADSFALLRKATTRPALEVLKLLDAAIFNLVIGNADAHAKNFSLLYTDASVALAPLYDLLCTALYPNVHAKQAMKIGGKAMLDEITTKNWEQFAEHAGLAPPFVLQRVKTLSTNVAALLHNPDSNFIQTLPKDFDFTSVRGMILDRAENVLASLEH